MRAVAATVVRGSPPDGALHADALVLSVDVVGEVNTLPCELGEHTLGALAHQRLRGDVIGRQAVEGGVLGTRVDTLARLTAHGLRLDGEADLLLSVQVSRLGDVTHLVQAFSCCHQENSTHVN